MSYCFPFSLSCYWFCFVLFVPFFVLVAAKYRLVKGIVTISSSSIIFFRHLHILSSPSFFNAPYTSLPLPSFPSPPSSLLPSFSPAIHTHILILLALPSLPSFPSLPSSLLPPFTHTPIHPHTRPSPFPIHTHPRPLPFHPTLQLSTPRPAAATA